MLGSHSPISANEANAANTISAARQPPKRSTISTRRGDRAPTQVIHSSASVNALTSQSANARKRVEDREDEVRVGRRALVDQPALEVVELVGQRRTTRATYGHG